MNDLLYGTYVQYYVPSDIWLPATDFSCVIDFSKHDVTFVTPTTIKHLPLDGSLLQHMQQTAVMSSDSHSHDLPRFIQALPRRCSTLAIKRAFNIWGSLCRQQSTADRLTL